MDGMFGFKRPYFAKASKGRRIYLDHASATPVLPAAADAVYRAMKVFANPGGINTDAVAARQLLERSRERIASHLGCKAREIIFTSGLTEANNIGIVGFARALERTRRTLAHTHWIVSSIEHSSVLECFAEVERMGGVVTHVDPEPNGIVKAERIKAALRPSTVFVSIGWGNNEIGTIQPLSRIARVLHEHEKKNKTTIVFHSDAGQAPLYHTPQVHSLEVDMLALGSGKLYGPRGVGALYISNRARLAPVIFGGGQERGLRSGTEDPALAVGFAEALGIVARERESEAKRLGELRDDFAREIIARIQGAVVNGSLAHALPHMLNISIPGERSGLPVRGTQTGEYLVLALDHIGIALSTKSACNEGEKTSRVVAALGGEAWRAENILRFSLGRETTVRDLTRAVKALQGLMQA